MVFGNGHYGDQRYHYQAETADLHEQETRQLLIPVEVSLGNAMRAQNTEAAVEDQPGLGDFQQCRGQLDVLAAGIEFQGEAAKQQ